jgi:hypothetical protein
MMCENNSIISYYFYCLIIGLTDNFLLTNKSIDFFSSQTIIIMMNIKLFFKTLENVGEKTHPFKGKITFSH